MVYFFIDIYKVLFVFRYVEISFYFLLYVNSVINLCFYIFFNERFNCEFKNIFRCCFCCLCKEDVNLE